MAVEAGSLGRAGPNSDAASRSIFVSVRHWGQNSGPSQPAEPVPAPLSLFPGHGGSVTAVHISVPCPSWTCLVKSNPPSRMDPSSAMSPVAGPTAGYRLPQVRADGPQLLADALVPSLRAWEWSPMPVGPSEPSSPFPSPLAPGGWSEQRQDALPAAAGWCSRGGPAGLARRASLLPL